MRDPMWREKFEEVMALIRDECKGKEAMPMVVIGTHSDGGFVTGLNISAYDVMQYLLKAVMLMQYNLAEIQAEVAADAVTFDDTKRFDGGPDESGG